MVLEQDLVFFSTLAQVAATFSGIMIAVLSYMLEKDRIKKLGVTFFLWLSAALMFGATAIYGIIEIPSLGTPYEAMYATSAIAIAGAALILVILGVLFIPKNASGKK